MTSPATILRTLLVQAKESLIAFCTDGGANDNKGVELTCTSTGSLNVNLTGGAVGGQTVAQGNPNAGGADAWPVKVDSALPAGSNSIGTVVLGAGTAKIGKVTDQPLTLAGVGQKTTTSSGAVTSGVSGAGYLTILNTDASLGAYLGTGTVDNTKFLLSAGASVTWPISDVTTINCFGTGAVLSWAFLQVA